MIQCSRHHGYSAEAATAAAADTTTAADTTAAAAMQPSGCGSGCGGSMVATTNVGRCSSWLPLLGCCNMLSPTPSSHCSQTDGLRPYSNF